MIIVRLDGGLGNQMFQYAAGKQLATKHSTILKLDISKFTSRSYDLYNFNIEQNIATPQEIEAIRQEKIVLALTKIIFKKRSEKESIIVENYFHFDPAFNQAPDNVYVDGFWQSEKYFIDIQDVIRQSFTVKHSQDEMNRKTAGLIRSNNSISLHIRRGDYVTDTASASRHGSCSLEYYELAIKHIKEYVHEPHFFIFSDDFAWTKENLKIDNPVTFVDYNGSNKNYEDIRLMSLCSHHIIANSSFSWWGAWLNPDPKKIVIAPIRWFNAIECNTTDLIPHTWIRL